MNTFDEAIEAMLNGAPIDDVIDDLLGEAKLRLPKPDPNILKWLGLKPKDLNKLLDKEVSQMVNDTVTQLGQIKALLDPYNKLFNTLKATRIKSKFDRINADVIDFGEVLAAIVSSQRTDYRGVVTALKDAKPELTGLIDDLMEAHTKTVEAISATDKGNIPKNFPHKDKTPHPVGLGEGFGDMIKGALDRVLIKWHELKDLVSGAWEHFFSRREGRLAKVTAKLRQV